MEVGDSGSVRLVWCDSGGVRKPLHANLPQIHGE